MNLDKIDNIFFIGIGGIGMSSIAQFFHDKGNIVFGYDQNNNRAIEILINKGIGVTNKLNLEEIPEDIMGDDLEIVYTPAIKKDNIFLNYFLLISSINRNVPFLLHRELLFMNSFIFFT